MTYRIQRATSPILGCALALTVAFGTRDASAEVEAAYADKLDVDDQYVTGVSGGATDIAFAADGRAIVITKTGRVYVRRTNGLKQEIHPPGGGPVFEDVDSDSEKGLLGVVADPNVATNRTFYFYVSNGPSSRDKHRVYKGVLSADAQNSSLTIDADDPIVGGGTGGHPTLEGPANHDGGGLFIYGGKLYVSVGDTGFNRPAPENKYGSCLNKGNGKILRVNLDGSVPTDNPLVSLTQVTGCESPFGEWTTGAPDKRIYAWGFRNPWRFWVDPKTGKLWIGDVGEGSQEEISVGGGDQHYGFPFYEGTDAHGNAKRLGKDCSDGFVPARPCTAPVHTYPREDQAASVVGGLIADDCGWTNVFGGKPHYLFADNNRGWLKALEVNDDRSGVVGGAKDFAAFNGGNPVSIRMDPKGSLYIVYHTKNAVFRITPKDPGSENCVVDPGPVGSGGAGGASSGGTGGTIGTGGTGNPGTGGTGGSSVSVGGSSNAGGARATGGSAGAGTAGGGSSGDDDGCSCRTVGKRGGTVGIVAGLGLLFAAWRRRRTNSKH